MASMLRYKPCNSVSYESSTQKGEQWSVDAKKWMAVEIGRDLRCGCCGKTIVEEPNSLFFLCAGGVYRHNWCQMVCAVDLDNMHHDDGDFGDCMGRFVDEVTRMLTVEEMPFPTMRVYQYFLTSLMQTELCDHSEDLPCSEENCSRLLTEDLCTERKYMTHYLKIAWKCGYMNTVDGLVDIYHSIADFFRPSMQFTLLDIFDPQDTLQKMWARQLARTMREIVTSVSTRNGKDTAREWLRSSTHLKSPSVRERMLYCKVVDTYFELDVLGHERAAIKALHESVNGSTIDPPKR